MNRAELINAIALKSGLKKSDAHEVIDCFIEIISQALRNNKRIALVGFGSFSVIDHKVRLGRNPQTGEQITIPAKRVVKFKGGSDLNSHIQ